MYNGNHAEFMDGKPPQHIRLCNAMQRNAMRSKLGTCKLFRLTPNQNLTPFPYLHICTCVHVTTNLLLPFSQREYFGPVRQQRKRTQTAKKSQYVLRLRRFCAVWLWGRLYLFIRGRYILPRSVTFSFHSLPHHTNQKNLSLRLEWASSF